MAVRGDHPMVIQWTAGHTDRDTTDGYLERARYERQRIGEPLPPPPPDLLTVAERVWDSVSDFPKLKGAKSRLYKAKGRPQRELKGSRATRTGEGDRPRFLLVPCTP
jgi:hypothetical protein